jgi:hypothetical protein
MAAIRSCGFLEGGQTETGHFYACCRLGDAQARLDWLKRLDPERLALLKTFRQALSMAVADAAEHLWALKGRQLHARRSLDLDDERKASAELDKGARDFEKVVETFLDGNAGPMARLGLPREDTSRLIRELLDDMVMRRSADTGPVPVSAELLSRFPPEVRAIFQPYEASRPEPSETP